MTLTDDDVREILRIIDESPLDELRIETQGFSLHVLKGGRADVASREATSARPTETPKLVPEPRQDGSSQAESDGLVTIEAPMLGTFYRAEGPGREPFVEIGSRVEPDSIVCIIEVMKMMNSVPAGVSGTIVEVCPENAQMVEYGEPLFRVQPA
jgi:acetyl-CoA carboxylase biotin carboxyl carrier protein